MGLMGGVHIKQEGGEVHINSSVEHFLYMDYWSQVLFSHIHYYCYTSEVLVCVLSLIIIIINCGILFHTHCTTQVS